MKERNAVNRIRVLIDLVKLGSLLVTLIHSLR
jgi:hypothetical protein